MSLKVRKTFYKNNLYRAFKGFVIPCRTLSILGCLLSYVRSTVCEFPFLSYCATSLAMLVSGSKRILKFHLREHVTTVRDMGWNNFSSFEESSLVPEKTFLVSYYLSQALTEDLRESVIIFSAFIKLRTAFSWCSTVICSYIYLKKQFDFVINRFVKIIIPSFIMFP